MNSKTKGLIIIVAASFFLAMEVGLVSVHSIVLRILLLGLVGYAVLIGDGLQVANTIRITLLTIIFASFIIIFFIPGLSFLFTIWPLIFLVIGIYYLLRS